MSFLIITYHVKYKCATSGLCGGANEDEQNHTNHLTAFGGVFT